jgi:hypothetical protein
MMEWQMAINQNWNVKLGAGGKGLKVQVDSGSWTELGHTFVGTGMEENWEALLGTIHLFRKVACEVTDRFGYRVPDKIDREVTASLYRVKGLKNYDNCL